MQSQRLKQHQVGEVLRHQKAARLALAQFLPRPLQRPAHCRLVRFLADMYDWRRHSEQHAGVISRQREAPADDQAIPAAVDRHDTANPAPSGQNREGLDWRRGQIGGEAERPAARQQKKVAS
jgi:hypothetical protein